MSQPELLSLLYFAVVKFIKLQTLPWNLYNEKSLLMLTQVFIHLLILFLDHLNSPVLF